jgi:hypothetical protein
MTGLGPSYSGTGNEGNHTWRVDIFKRARRLRERAAERLAEVRRDLEAAEAECRSVTASESETGV